MYISTSSYPCMLPLVYSQVIITHYVSIISLFSFSLPSWEGPDSKHFTVSPHLLVTKHMTNKNGLDLKFDLICTGRKKKFINDSLFNSQTQNGQPENKALHSLLAGLCISSTIKQLKPTRLSCLLRAAC